MGWRSIVISNPSKLTLSQNSLQVLQNEGSASEVAKVPLEDISVLVIENSCVTISVNLLSACADAQIVVIVVGDNYIPNGILLPYLPHSRALKVMQAQLSLSQVRKKQLWRYIIQQKIRNQAAVLLRHQQFDSSRRLSFLATTIRSGDSTNIEAQAGQIYFRSLFGSGFSRQKDFFYNSLLNYGYAILRAAIARTLCSYGFLPTFGLFHHSELNNFNLADDIIEPYRQYVDDHVMKRYSSEMQDADGVRMLTVQDKAALIKLLHQDITLNRHHGERAECTMLAGIEATVISLSRTIMSSSNVTSDSLVLPQILFEETASFVGSEECISS